MAEVHIRPGFGAERSLVRLRVATAEAARAAALLELPAEPLNWSGEDPAALWMAPDQWLLVGERLSAEQLIESCRTGLGEVLHNATDATDAFSCSRVEGTGARALLAMGSGVDFAPSALRAGQCVRTRFARVAVLIRVLEGECFELFVDRSVDRYLERWLERAARDPLFES